LRIGREPAHPHVIEHALAQRVDRLIAHWGSCLEGGVLDPSILKTERPSPALVQMVTAADVIARPRRQAPPARAGSFFGPKATSVRPYARFKSDGDQYYQIVPIPALPANVAMMGYQQWRG
jgi:hypothetical protein